MEMIITLCICRMFRPAGQHAGTMVRITSPSASTAAVLICATAKILTLVRWPRAAERVEKHHARVSPQVHFAQEMLFSGSQTTSSL